MEPERTTTMGEGESESTESPFHIMKAVERISAKFRICAAACRGFWRRENMLVVVGLKLLRMGEEVGLGGGIARTRETCA